MKQTAIPFPMRQRTSLLCVVLLTSAAFFSARAQTGVTIGASTAPDVSAALDIVSSTKGALLPRVADATALATPATGLLVFQTNAPAGFYYNAGTPAAPSWQRLNVVGGPGDNLGNHTATQALNLQANALTGSGAVLPAGVLGLGIRADGGLNIGQNPAVNSMYLGYQAGAAVTTGVRNHFVGDSAGLATTTGLGNHFEGYRAGLANTSGGYNLALGYLAGRGTTTGSFNTFIGLNAGAANAAGSQNHFVGYRAGQINTASFNHFEGYRAGELNTTGANNHFSGYFAGNANTIGGQNYFSGHRAGRLNTEGSRNTFSGYQAGSNNLTGNDNTAVGYNSGPASGSALSNATALGANVVLTQSNTVVLGNNASVGIGTSAPDASAVLDVSSTSKGLLPPRMSQSQRDAIQTPAAGLTVYNATKGKLNTWNGTSWDAVLSATEQPFAASQTFNYTGGPQTYTVPAGVTSLTVDAAGASGGGNGGRGARVQATLTVTPGEVLTLYVGGTSGGNAAGYNGGGAAINAGKGGGGASDVRRSATAPSTSLAERLLVAAGGGGGGGNGANGGAAGAPNGVDGGNSGGSGGQGATQTAAGSGGSLGQGGAGTGPNYNYAGGGGGGYYGGGGGDYFAGGGGGSSWVTPAGSSGVTMTGYYQGGNGVIVLTLPTAYAAPVLDGSNFINVPGDNLGNHTATQNLNLGTNQLVGTTAVNVGSTLNLGANTLVGTTAVNLGSNLNLGTNALVGNGGSTGLRISSGGNVGIGTSTPNGRLSITPSTIEPKITLWDGGIANATSHYGFGISGSQLNYHVSSATDNHVFYAGGRNGDGTELLRIQGNGTVSTSGELRVQVATNRLRRANSPQKNNDLFDPGGASGVHVSSNEFSSEEGGFWANDNYAAIYSPGDNDLVKFLDEDGFDNSGTVYDGSALKARIDGNGQYFQVSDAQAKHDITPIADGLRKLTALSGYTYAFNLLPKEAEKGQKPLRAAGVLAQEVEQVLPEAVSQQDGHYMVNYAALAPLFIQAIKELKAENDALQARTAAAEAQAAQATAATQALEARLRRLEAAGEGQVRK